MDKEVINFVGMGAWEIVESRTIPEGCNVMNTCFSFQVKCDSKRNIAECRARGNADGRQQKPGSWRDICPNMKVQYHPHNLCDRSTGKLTLHQFDIRGAFLMASCKEPVYMNLPGRYRLPNSKPL